MGTKHRFSDPTKSGNPRIRAPAEYDGQPLEDREVTEKRRFLEAYRLTIGFDTKGVYSQSERKYVRAQLDGEDETPGLSKEYVYLPMRLFTNKQEVINRLHHAELLVPYWSYSNAFWIEAARVTEFDRHFVLERAGWDENYFVHRDGSYFRADRTTIDIEREPITSIRDVDLSTPFRAEIVFPAHPWRNQDAGSCESYAAKLSSMLAGQDLLTFGLVLGLAPPLLKWSPLIDNFGFELVGPAFSGKTTVARLATSIWGKPSADGELERADSFVAHLDHELGYANDQLLTLDGMERWFAMEGAARQSEYIRRLADAFNYAHEFPEGFYFPRSRFLIFATSRESITDLCEDEVGARVRLNNQLIRIEVPTSRAGGVVRRPAHGLPVGRRSHSGSERTYQYEPRLCRQ